MKKPFVTPKLGCSLVCTFIGARFHVSNKHIRANGTKRVNTQKHFFFLLNNRWLVVFAAKINLKWQTSANTLRFVWLVAQCVGWFYPNDWFSTVNAFDKLTKNFKQSNKIYFPPHVRLALNFVVVYKYLQSISRSRFFLSDPFALSILFILFSPIAFTEINRQNRNCTSG